MTNPTTTAPHPGARASGSMADAPHRPEAPDPPTSGHPHLIASLLRQTAKGLLAGNAAEWSAAIAYYGLLSAFPFLLVAASLAAIVVDGRWAVEQATGVLAGFLPEGGEQVERIVQGAVASRGRIGLLSALALVWTGGRAFAALTLALNAICGDDAADDAPRRFLVSVAMLVVVGLAFACALMSGLLVDDLWRLVGVFPGDRSPAFAAARTAVQATALLVAYGLVYRFVPRVRQERRAILVGAVAATFLFLGARPLFLLAVARSETYRITYGPLALAAILMVWAWVVAFITLAGGQLAMLTNAALRGGSGADACPLPGPSHPPAPPRRPGATGPS